MVILLPIFLGATFVAGLLAVLALGIFLRSGDAPQFTGSEAELDALAAELPREFIDRQQPPGALDAAFTRLLSQAGSNLSAGSASMVALGGLLLGGAVLFVLTENLLATAAGMFVGGIVPFLGWTFRRWRRQKEMRKSLPEALEIVADVVRAGRNLEQACTQVAREIAGPLGEEFAAAAAHLRLGQAAPAVLERMLQRVPLPEFKIFATAVLVHRLTGGNLALLTERLARAARDRQEFQGHLSAVTAGSRLSAIGLILGSVVAVIALSTLQPTYYQKFFEHHWGFPLACAAVGLQLTGIAWVYRLLKVNY
ncbi:MAG TPA: type II secretion system F family protein [Pirellulales bacterium]|jgi:tight adherence protein B|nr:type II secretion system F family protein [Pirellulales bacterium]